MNINRCPKCGKGASVITWSIAGDTIGYEAECYDCGLHTGRCDTKEEAIEKWNELTNNLVTKKISKDKIENILAEMRALGKLDEKSTDKIPRSLQALGLKTYADRIEAIIKAREQNDTYQVEIWFESSKSWDVLAKFNDIASAKKCVHALQDCQKNRIVKLHTEKEVVWESK